MEVLVGMMLNVLTGLAVVTFAGNSGRNLACLANYVDLQYSSRQALDTMSRDIRQCVQLQEYSTNRLAFINEDGLPLVFEYSPGKRTLERTRGSVTTVLLTECNYLQFTIFKRNPKAGTLVHDATTTVAGTKVINVSWRCSRSVLGVNLTTEAVESARIVMRKD